MPFASHRGQRIHYTVEGSGPLVVLQHGLLMNAESWRRNGFVGALWDGYRVACVDSLGHGRSDKPSDPVLYDEAQRAGDVIAVIDDLGCERAHLIGYSMGGWLCVGITKYYPRRLSSLVLGGWDLVDGLPRGLDGPVSFDLFLRFATAGAPSLVRWIRPEFEPGLRACFEALSQVQGAAEALLNAGVPVMTWAGRDDLYHDAMQAFATANAIPFLPTGGDHVEAILHPGPQIVAAVRAFLDGVQSGSPL